MQMLYRFLKDETGATAIEYGLIAALVSVVIITAVATSGGNLTATFTSINTCLADPERPASSSSAMRASPPVGRRSGGETGPS